jgi:hypothetical protein
MFSTLLSAELQVQESYVRWTGSLRRFLTRSAHGRYQRLLALADRALYAGAEWTARDPGTRTLDRDVLGIGTFAFTDASQTQLWRDVGAQQVQVQAAPETIVLTEAARAALRLAAGTSRRAVARTVNSLLAQRHVVSGADAYDATPAEFQRLGVLVTLLDLGIAHGRVRNDLSEQVLLIGLREQPLRVVFPHVIFDRHISEGRS